MYPCSPRSTLVCLTIGLLAGSATLRADQDLPPPDVNKLLRDLHSLRDQQAVQAKTSRQTAIQQISAAAGSVEKGVALWEEAVRATQMEGAGKENAQFRQWKDTEGELFKEKEVQNAVHLHLEWLLITLERANGTSVKDLLTPINNYARELLADQAWMESLDDLINKEKAAVAAGPGKQRLNPNNQKAKDDTAIRRTHDGILNHSLNNSIVVQWLKLGDLIAMDKWEHNPGNFDGIYTKIVQPELRTQRDPHVFDYWDAKLKKEADAATKTKLSFEVDKFNSQRRPALLWNRVQEYTYLGQKNRAISEMFNLIKTYPTHPDAPDWASALEAVLAPPAPDTATTTAAPPAPIAPAAPVNLPPAPAPAPGVSPSTASLPGAQ
jgi:hypothetical protein